MYESVPQPRRIYSAPQDDWDEDDYDVFLFYPSRYRAFQVRQPAPSRPLSPLKIPPTPLQCPRARLSWEWDGYDASSGTSEVRGALSSGCFPSQLYLRVSASPPLRIRTTKTLYSPTSATT